MITTCGGCRTTVKTTPPPPQVITSTYFDSIQLEIAYIGSSRPPISVIEHFENEIVRYKIAKRVSHIIHQVSYPEPELWNSGHLAMFESKCRYFRDITPKNRHLKLFVAYLPGRFLEGDYDNIAGLAYGGTSFAVFSNTISETTQGNVFVHELGHLLQFVNLSARKETPINPERPRHCNNESCVMFWRASKDRTTFDDDCIDQLADKIRDRQDKRLKAKLLGPL
jgi:hypothetical protein